MAKRKNKKEEDSEFELFETQEEVVEENVAAQSKNQGKAMHDLNQSKAKTKQQEEAEKAKNAERVKEAEKEKPEDKDLQAEEYKNLLQLTRAEFDNYRKRSFTLIQNAKIEGEVTVITKFLPALDSFDKAKNMISDPKVLKGVEMIEKDIKKALKTMGVEEVNPKGEIFDANFHNALSTMSDPEIEENTITQVYQNGYMYNGKVIRYAQVIINKP